MRTQSSNTQRIFALLAIAAMLTPPLSAQNAPKTSQPGQNQPAQSAQPPAPVVNPAQLPPPPPPPAPAAGGKGTIRSAVDLVEIDAQVTDRSGKPIKGLTKDQFSISEDGKAQSISTFEYNDIEKIETANTADEAPISVPLGVVATPEDVRKEVRDHRMIVMFFDMTSLQPDDLLRSTRAGVKYIQQQMTPADLVGVVAFGDTLKVVANFTNDKDLLQQAVEALVPGHDAALQALADAASAADGETAVSEDTGAAFTADDTEFNVFNTDRKLAAIEALCEILDGIPGKKSIIQFTSGITQTGEENRSELIAATNAANRSNVSIYSVDSRGLLTATPGGDASVGASSGTAMFSGATVISQSQSRQDSRDTLATLSGDTGGRSFFDTGDFGKVFQSVQGDNSGYYLLGYYSTNGARDGRWRRVQVKATLPAGAHIRYREGYYAPKDFGVFTTEDRERQLEEAMTSDTPYVELPVAVETAQFRINQNQVFVPIAAKLAPSALQWAQKRGSHEANFDFAAEVRDAKTNRVVGALRDTITVKLDSEQFQQIQQQRSLLYQGGMLLAPGNYKLKFLARENESGRIGTFEEPLIVSAAQPNQLQLSSLMLSSQVEEARNAPEVKVKALGADARMKSSPLEVAGERIVPSVTRVFTDQQTLYVFFQAYLPQGANADALRAGLVFFRNGQRLSDTPMIPPAEYDEKTRTAAFRLSLPLASLGAGRYTVQAIAVDAGTPYAGFARDYFALQAAAKPAAQAVTPSPTNN